MAKKNLKQIIFGAICILGLTILMNSISYGSNEVSNIINANGGSMDTNKYLIYLEQSIIKYRSMGLILSAFGGLGLLIATNKKS